MEKARELLRTVFGYESFRSDQENCICSVLKGEDTLLIMPTGGGKSLCYQIPALMFEGLTVVISPLISLMADQVYQLKAWGVEAEVLNSALTDKECADNIASVKSGKTRILFLAPETLIKPATLKLLSSLRVDFFVIDEAHCISDWGHDFRPEYRQLVKARAAFPKAVCLAMTATATERVRKDILANLKIEAANEFVASFNRPNLFYEIIAKSNPFKQTLDFLKRFPNQSGIVYCFSRQQVDDLAASLDEQGFSARPYHAGLSTEERTRNQELFIRDDVQIMVATIAFGVGINKSNVRFVLHYNLPKNIESYYQETGRAGRDGLPAHCLLLFGYGDIHNIRFLIDKKNDEVQKRASQMHLNDMLRYCESETCRRISLLSYFGEEWNELHCGQCDNCLDVKQPTFDMTQPAIKFLRCVKLTGQKFGASHLVDILRGSASQKVTRFGHERLPIYGEGKEYSTKQWQSIARQLIQKGLLAQDHEAYGALKYTPKSTVVMNDAEQIMGFLPEKEIKSREVKVETAPTHDENLFQILRKKRKELADKAGLPPYVIFSDKSLLDMSVRLPQTKEAFSGIFGVGAKKLESYDELFTDLIRQYLEDKKTSG